MQRRLSECYRQTSEVGTSMEFLILSFLHLRLVHRRTKDKILLNKKCWLTQDIAVTNVDIWSGGVFVFCSLCSPVIAIQTSSSQFNCSCIYKDKLCSLVSTPFSIMIVLQRLSSLPKLINQISRKLQPTILIDIAWFILSYCLSNQV